MIYRIIEDQIQIITIRDGRGDPNKLKKILKNS